MCYVSEIFNIVFEITKKNIDCDKWQEHATQLATLFRELKPDKPEDGSQGFIAFNVPDKPRMKLKTARFLTRKLNLNNGFLPDCAIQQIAEKINLVLFSDNLIVQLVHGKAITKAYRDEIGSRSCMTGSSADCTLLYEMNPKRFSMLIMKCLNNNARAIVHKLDNKEFYLDRIYSNSTELIEKMQNYAIQHKWHYQQSGKIPSCSSSILNVSNLDFEDGHIPYMDTMIYGTIYNDKLNISATMGNLNLLSTDGYLIDKMVCESCGEPISEENCYPVNDYYYCSDCFHEYYIYCESCGEAVSIDDYIQIEGSGECFCEHCADKKAWKCDDCNEWFLTDKNQYSAHGDIICEDCTDNYKQCKSCEQYFEEEELDENSRCENCCDCVGQLLLYQENQE